jgi:O-Antigen ligase
LSLTTPETARLGRQRTTVAIAVLLLWLPLQTPAAIFAYQYLHVSPNVDRAILLLKDAAVGLVIAYLFVSLVRRHGLRGLRMLWFDWLALIYVGLLGAYSVIPVLAGSKLPILAVAASLREFLVPVELYALGRLAVLAGVSRDAIVKWFLAVALLAASATVLLYAFVPVQFWSSTLDLVSFERDIQGIGNAHTLWDISLLGQYGVGDSGTFPRAVGPFTHPVGTAFYFVVPLLLAVPLVFALWRQHERRKIAVALGVSLVLAAAVITPISRGSWIAAVVGVLIAGLAFRRVLAVGLALALVGVVLLATPPFSYSITSVLNRSDSSVVGHEDAVQKGVHVVLQNPAGLGVGQSDYFGSTLSGGGSTAGALSSGDAGSASAGVGENMYLSVLVAIGPIGLVALAGWMIGLALHLLPRRRADVDWIDVGLLAALAGSAISALTASALMRFTTSASFWLLVGLAVARTAGETRPSVAAILRSSVATIARRNPRQAVVEP